jgi:hypothetical protein
MYQVSKHKDARYLASNTVIEPPGGVIVYETIPNP